jgi:plasmid replication initiation protein
MDLVEIGTHKNNIVKKHQDLVRNARYGLGDLSIKTLSILISMVKKTDDSFKEYSIKLTDLKELIGAKSHNVDTYVDRMTTELLSNPFMIDDANKVNWVTIAEYVRGSGIVKFEIHRKLKPYLLELNKNFLQYNITNILVLKSAYVIRLYELCKDHYLEGTRYQNKKNVIFELKIDTLRELFQIPKSYQYSSHIKKLIINKAQKQFKEKTDIKISYTEQKIGRKVDRILITVTSNAKGSGDFLASRISFIKYIRTNYINKVLVKADDPETKKEKLISVSSDGKLYNQNNPDEVFTAVQGNTLWDWLYGLAKDNKLKILNKGD